MITDDEIAHGLSLLADVKDQEELGYSCQEIDHFCGWPVLGQPCSARIDRVCILNDEERINVVAFCDHHADCMTAAIEKSRTRN